MEVSTFINASSSEDQINIQVLRDGNELTLTVKPKSY